jgi:hypothetical protein
MTLGQYNAYKIARDVRNPFTSFKIKPGFYPETNWNFGNQYYEDIADDRRCADFIDHRLHFRGSVYPGLRDCVKLLAEQHADEVFIGQGRLPFEEYLAEAAGYSMTLSMGMSPYHSDLCFRDIEMFGLGIPVLRPTLHVELAAPLIPNVHYIAVDVDLDPYTLWAKDAQQAADAIFARYKEVVDDYPFLHYISKNARTWYNENIVPPNVVNNLVNWITV